MSQFHIGRQPIFNHELEITAYELLYRSSHHNVANVINADQATSTVIVNAFTELGLANLVGQRPAFINMPYHFLVDPQMIGFPPDQVVLEILEDIVVDQALVNSVQAMVDQGYTFALDDFIYDKQWEPLVELAKIIKFDVTQLSREALRGQVVQMQQRGKLTLAERIETQDEFDSLKEFGFDYYQGYFFAKPKVIAGKCLASNKMSLIQMLAKINEPTATIESLSDLVSADLSLSLKTMKFINSPITGLSKPIENIHQAVVLLGLDTLKSWLTVITLSELDDKPEALTNLALTRARLCQLMAKSLTGLDPQAAFTAGLFSLLDTMLDRPMSEVLQTLPLADDVRSALLGNNGPLGELLTDAIDVETAFCDERVAANEEACALHLQAMQWADQASGSQAA